MARSTLWKHRKFRRLVMELKNKALAVGVLECLWSCGYDSGDDLIGSSEEVEVASGWAGKRGTLTPILESIGWIDATPEGYRIHDLYDHAPDYVQRRRRRELQRGQRADSDRTLTGHRQDTDPNPPTRTPLPLPLPLARCDGFDSFWSAYPRKVGKGAAKKAWSKNVHNGDAAKIEEALKWQIVSDQWKRDGGQYIPNPATYLNQRRWEDEPLKVEGAWDETRNSPRN